MSTQLSRGRETTVACPPPAGMCRIIRVSVLTDPPSSWVDSWASTSGLALAGRLSSPTSRMFCAGPSLSGPEAPIASTWRTPEAKPRYSAQP
jgi:hypothetical protein